jgi:hypothetical protein
MDKSALKIIGPAVIRTTEALSSALRLGHHCGGVMTADVEEAAQNRILAAYDQYRLAGSLAGEVLSGLAHLIGASDHEPGAGKNAALLQKENATVSIPRCGWSERFSEGVTGIVGIDYLRNRLCHPFVIVSPTAGLLIGGAAVRASWAMHGFLLQ